MNDNALAIDDVIAEFRAELICRRWAMEPGGDEQGHLDVGVSRTQLLEHEGDYVLAGNGTRVVTHDNGASIFSYCEF